MIAENFDIAIIANINYFNSIQIRAFGLSCSEHSFRFIKLPYCRIYSFFTKGVNKSYETKPSISYTFIISSIAIYQKVFFRVQGFSFVIYNVSNLIFKQFFQKSFCSFNIIIFSVLKFRGVILEMIMMGKIEHNNFIFKHFKAYMIFGIYIYKVGLIVAITPIVVFG